MDDAVKPDPPEERRLNRGLAALAAYHGVTVEGIVVAPEHVEQWNLAIDAAFDYEARQMILERDENIARVEAAAEGLITDE